MSDHVYLIASGAYSDYSISCAFTTLDVAIEYAAHRNKVAPDVQRRWHELEAMPYGAEQQREEAVLEREHNFDDYSYRVEVCDLHETLPVVKS